MQPQDYMLTARISLANRSDYTQVLEDIRNILKTWESASTMQVDFVALEKVKSNAHR